MKILSIAFTPAEDRLLVAAADNAVQIFSIEITVRSHFSRSLPQRPPASEPVVTPVSLGSLAGQANPVRLVLSPKRDILACQVSHPHLCSLHPLFFHSCLPSFFTSP